MTFKRGGQEGLTEQKDAPPSTVLDDPDCDGCRDEFGHPENCLECPYRNHPKAKPTLTPPKDATESTDIPATDLPANPFNDALSYPECPNCGSTNVFMENWVRFCTLCKKDMGVYVVVDVPGKWRDDKTVQGRFEEPGKEVVDNEYH